MISSGVGGTPIMDVACDNNVLAVAVNLHSNRNAKPLRETLMTVINSSKPEYDSDVQFGTLMNFHSCLRHLCFVPIIKMAINPASGIRLTEMTRQKASPALRERKLRNPNPRRIRVRNHSFM